MLNWSIVPSKPATGRNYLKFMPNKNIIRNDKGPPWFNNQMEKLIEKRNLLFEYYMTNGRLVVDHN